MSEEKAEAMSDKIQVRIMRLPHTAHLTADLPLPAYEGTHSAAGLDLLAAVTIDPPIIIIAPGGRAAIPTGLVFALPPGVEMQIRGIPALALFHGITVLNSHGVLDDYRGELQVILANLGKEPFEVKHGARIARLVFTPTVQAYIHEVTSLDETTRGIRGFGSTGDAPPS